MKLCDKDCIPCCDFCIHVSYSKYDCGGRIVNGGPDGCTLHLDKEHQDIAIGCGYCDDFHCFDCKN